jgi:hypothetical protein
MRRRFEVEVSGTVTIEIDDEARSDWKPEQGILDTVQDPERFLPGSDMETLLLALAVTVGIENRTVGGTDGWADFPPSAVTRWGRWPDWQCDGWREITDGPR